MLLHKCICSNVHIYVQWEPKSTKMVRIGSTFNRVPFESLSRADSDPNDGLGLPLLWSRTNVLDSLLFCH